MNEPDPAATETSAAPSPGATLSVRQHLALFTAVLVVPIILLCALLFWQIASGERKRLESDAGASTVALAAAIDRDLSGLMAALDVLSLSANLQTGNLEGFQRQIEELDARQGLIVVLSDPAGQQLANPRVPWGAALPRSNVPLDRQALDRGRPYVTELFRGAVSGGHFFAVVTSVSRGGTLRYVLTLALAPDHLRRILIEAEMPESATVAVVDTRGVIVARNHRQEEFVGRPATRDLIEAAVARRGTWDGTTADGNAVFGTYAKSSLSDFTVAIGIRHSDLNAPVWRFLAILAALAAVIAALSTIAGLVLAKRITRPIQALTDRAALLGRGEAVPALATGLKEADAVGHELANAAWLRRAREAELVEANEEIQRFAYIVSHDLRSPLVNIMGFTSEVEALRDDAFKRLDALRSRLGEEAGGDEADRRLSEDFDEAIGFIKASIDKMDRLINAILKLSREGRREFHAERVDMDALVAGISASLAHQADAAGASVRAGRLPAVSSDRLALEQIFSNLVDNALKYLRDGVPGRIEISGRDTVGGYVYEVRDNGRGIDPKDRERVFELFRRSGVQDRPGEGIGLAHVRSLVRRIGGSIGLTSTPGQGSVFTVTLPRRLSAETLREAA